MKSIRNLERLQQLHDWIEKEQTGTSLELAQKMNISQRLVYILMEELKDYQATIGYDRHRKTYYYTDDFQLTFNVSVSIMGCDRTAEVFKGSYL